MTNPDFFEETKIENESFQITILVKLQTGLKKKNMGKQNSTSFETTTTFQTFINPILAMVLGDMHEPGEGKVSC